VYRNFDCWRPADVGNSGARPTCISFANDVDIISYEHAADVNDGTIKLAFTATAVPSRLPVHILI
jgi:hypothetical protein